MSKIRYRQVHLDFIQVSTYRISQQILTKKNLQKHWKKHM